MWRLKYIVISIGLLLLCQLPVIAQSDTSSIAHFYNRIKILLAEDKNNEDSLSIYKDLLRARYLEYMQLETYCASFLELAKSFYSKGYPKLAMKTLQILETDGKQLLGDHYTLEAEVRYEYIKGFYYLRDYHTFIKEIEHSLHELQVPLEKEPLIKSNFYNLLGVAYRAINRPLQALEAYAVTLRVREDELGQVHDLVASVLNNIGNVYVDLGLYSKGLASLERAIRIRKKLLGESNPSLAVLYLNIGNLYDDKGEYKLAIQYYHDALVIFQAHPGEYELRIADVFNNLATSYKNKGALQESDSYHRQAIQKYKQLLEVPSEKVANVYTNWSNLSKLQKNYALAIRRQQEALRLYRQTLAPNHPRVIAAANNLALVYADSGAYDQALAQLQSIVPLIENDTTQRAQFANLNNDLADSYYHLGNYAAAKSMNQKALAIQVDLYGRKSYKLAYTFNSLAQIAEAEGRRDTALQYLQQALAANHQSFQLDNPNGVPSSGGFFRFDYFVASLMHQARLLEQSGEKSDLIQANTLYKVADSTLTLVRNELLSAEDKIRLSDKVYQLSKAMIENCWQLTDKTSDQGYLEAAFQASEAGKQAVLEQSIAANHARQFAGIPDSLIALEDQLQSDLHFYKLHLAEQPDSLQRKLYENELFTAQQAYRALTTRLESAYPTYYQLKYDQSALRVRSIQAALPEQTALVSYFTGDTLVYSFVITKKEFGVYRSPIGKNFYSKLMGLRKSITNRLNADYVEFASDLYLQLFPFTLDSNIHSLVIVPDGILSKLPFEALLSKKPSPGSTLHFSQLPYLINAYSVSYALSGRLYYQELSLPPVDHTGGELLAYAPVFAEPQEIGLFADGTRNPLAAFENETRTVTADGKYVSALPATVYEIQAIAEIFKQQGQAVHTFLFQKANENQFKAHHTGQNSYLHIATHGFINESQPDLSGLLFFPDTTELEDHILFTGEVYGLPIKARLVVLSACETGLGKIANGEGLLGLSRAFIYAGAENLVVSLWQVEDEATADLMVDFYRDHFKGGGQQFAAPLRKAKLDMIHSATFSHPYYWSAFVLIGR